MMNVNQKKFLRLLYLLLFIPVFAWGQTKTITGVVKDASGETVIGASVLETGTTNGTVTGMDGDFTLTVGSQSSLTVSYMGYLTQVVSVGGKTQFNVTLIEDTQALDEVVVIGYGTAKKTDISGSIVSTDARTIGEVPALNASTALQGRLPGIEMSQTSTRPGATMQIRIRGERSLTSSANEPLVVVDGIPFSGSLNDISPNDIKNIDILKDASATAIYGSRGANGVILVTTTRGNAGGAPTITYNGYYGIKNVSKKYPIYDGEEYQAFHDASTRVQAGSYGYTELQKAVIASGNYVDWQDLIYQSAHTTSHDITVSSGSNKGAYSFSGGYYNENAVIPLQEYTRYSLRTTVDQEIGSRVKVGLTSQNSYGVTDGEGYSPMYSILAGISPISPAYNEDGSFRLFPLEGHIDGTSVNPLYSIMTENARAERRKRLSTFNALYGEVKIIDGLTYRINLGLSYSQENYGSFSAVPAGAPGVSSATVQNRNQTNWAVENLIYYNKILAQKHRLSFTAMFSAEETEYNQSQMQAADLAANYLTYYNLGLANGEKNITASNQSYWKRGLESLMARAQYTYDDRYMLTATFRSDGSSVLSPGYQWHNYPAFSAGWNIYREGFMSDITAISQLKLRLGYGQTSNQAIAPYSTLGGLSQTYYNYGPGATGVYAYYVSSLPNTNLGWEYTENYNLGVDYGFLDGRITGYIDMYLQKTKDILLSVALPPTSGVSNNVMQNVGSTQNKGLEFAVSAQIIKPQNNGFGWDVDFNLYLNRNELTSLNSGVAKDIGNGFFVGYPINVVYDYEKLGIWQENEREEAAKYGYTPGQIKVADLDNDGAINADSDRKILGSFEPDFAGGLTFRFTYKSFDLSIVSFFKKGGLLISTIHQPQSYFMTHNGRRNSTKVDYWTPTNPTNAAPQPGNQSADDQIDFGSTLGYFDASFWKIRTLSLGYTFNKSLLSAIGGKSARLYLTCQNPFTLFSPYMNAGGVDPEATGTGGQGANSSMTGGIPSRQLTIGANTPPTRNFILGLNVRF
jgi:TonB-linked SusC/RagA family outer membrane protein